MAYTYISPTPAALPLLYTKGSPPLRRTSPPSHLPGDYIAARQLPPIAKMVFLPLLQTLLEPHRCSPVGSVVAGHSTDTTQLSPMGAITGKRRIPHHSSWMIFLALITPARLPGRDGFLLPDLATDAHLPRKAFAVPWILDRVVVVWLYKERTVL